MTRRLTVPDLPPLAEDVLLDLARAGEGKLVDGDPVLRCLVWGEPLPGEREQLSFVDALAESGEPNITW